MNRKAPMTDMHADDDEGKVVGRVETWDSEYDEIREDDTRGPFYTGAEGLPEDFEERD